jgi:hypothetical protein
MLYFLSWKTFFWSFEKVSDFELDPAAKNIQEAQGNLEHTQTERML